VRVSRTNRVLRALLSFLLPRDHRAPLLSELDDECGGNPRAYRRQVLASLPHACRLRFRHALPRGVIGDIRYSLRALKRAPWYFLSTSAVIAISIAFGVTAFAIVDGALFRPLPYRDADRIVMVSPLFSKVPPRQTLYDSSIAERDAWIEALPGATFGWANTGGLAVLGRTESVNSAWVTRHYLDALGITPLFGGFQPSDFDAFVPIQPALLTYGLWRERFGGDPEVLGRVFADEQRGIRVVGVLPPGFVMPGPWVPRVITPLVESRTQDRHARVVDRDTIVRLPAGLSQDEAASRLLAATLQLAPQWPVSPTASTNEFSRILSGPADGVRVEPIREALTANVRSTAWVVLVSALSLIVLACLNVSSLAAARTQDRWRGLSVRRALGARPVEIFRLLSIEHAIVVACGVLAGMAAAGPLLSATLAVMPPYLLLQDAQLNLRVVVFAIGLATLCLMTIAILSTRSVTSVQQLRRSMGDATATGPSRPWLLGAQVGVATVVVVAAALIVGSLVRVQQEPLGFDLEGRVLVEMSMPRNADAQRIEAIIGEFRGRPEIVAIGATDRLLLQRVLNWSVFDPPQRGVRSYVGSFAVTTGFFEAVGPTLREGRFPTEAELLGGARVVVMSATAVKAYWPEGHVLGRTLALKGVPFVVVGIVDDARYSSWELDSRGDVYLPMTTTPTPLVSNVVAVLRPGSSAGDLAKALAASCPDCRVWTARPMEEALLSTIQSRRFRGWLFSAFGMVALIITATGVLGVVAMTSARRTREVGIRLALGSTRPGVVGLIVREQLGATVGGVLVGAAVAAGAVRSLTTYLYKATAYDPVFWATGVGVLLVVAIGAAILPSLRASRVNLVSVLKSE
jgi:putative ABC transport system permease protein